MFDFNKIVIDRASPSGIAWRNGKPAGTLRKDGYWRVGKEKVYVHKIVWELYYGTVPEGFEVDHIDGNPSNNLIENLQIKTHAENMCNTKKRKHNKTGVNGVSKLVVGDYSYYTAQWHEGGKLIVKRFSINKLGDNLALALAVQARKSAEQLLNKFTNRHGT